MVENREDETKRISRKWTDEEKRYLVTYKTDGAERIAAALGRSVISVRVMACRMHVSLVEVEGDENYKDFIAVVNKHIEKQQKTLKNRESRGDDDSDDTDETPEEPTDTPDNPSETPEEPTDTPDETPENPDEQPGGQEDDDRPVVQ